MENSRKVMKIQINYEYYSQFFDEPSDLEYVWPNKINEKDKNGTILVSSNS